MSIEWVKTEPGTAPSGPGDPRVEIEHSADGRFRIDEGNGPAFKSGMSFRLHDQRAVSRRDFSLLRQAKEYAEAMAQNDGAPPAAAGQVEWVSSASTVEKFKFRNADIEVAHSADWRFTIVRHGALTAAGKFVDFVAEDHGPHGGREKFNTEGRAKEWAEGVSRGD